MADVVSPSPSFLINRDDHGTIAANLAVPGETVKSLGTINWAALLQAIVAAVPAILAILSAFASTPTPNPVPPPAK